ncbi:uncharacterized protein JCM15063_006307 [Sporobolomyces koalae]|uniref:uncharacterized protein n=1 Tax=Sporobolomyces koalae TaxID=500713 RepID=UPI00317AB7A9
MPSLALTVGGAALAFAVASNAAGHIDSSPIHLRASRSNLRRRQYDDSQSTASATTSIFAAASLPPPKQDCTYASNTFKSATSSQGFRQLLQANIEAASEAIKLGKNQPAQVDLQRRDEPQPNWRWNFGGSTPIRGVNLGGWLPWITPSLYAASGNDSVVDEWTFCESLGYEEAHIRLSSHWDTWYTEADFAEIASYGLNHVRIPIGYWAFETKAGEPYVSGQYPYLLKAIGWAEKHGLKVMVDVHGAPGSQNGFDNSGRRGNATWQTSTQNVDRTLNVVSKLAKEFAKPKYANTVTILQALNEPAGFISQQVIDVYRQFAYDSYGRVRYPNGNTPSDVVLSLHDAFQPLSVWEKSFPSPQFSGVSLSDHPYFVFNSADLQKSDDERVATICGMKQQYAEANSNLWTILDEFSAAVTDCAGSLNGRGIGSRYDGSYPGSYYIGSCTDKTGNAATFSEEYKKSLGKSWQAQTSVWEESTSGWVSWCFKAENADDWSYQAGVKYGWIPRDPNQRIYGDLCASS